MIIPVHMFAFADEGDRSKIRPVEIPDEEIKAIWDSNSQSNTNTTIADCK